MNVTLNPLEFSNVSVIKIPIGSIYYLVEARKQIGYDAQLPSYGVLILYCNDSRVSGDGPVRVINAHPSDTTLNSTAFNVGESFNDASKGITITVLASLGSSFKVQVNYQASNIRITATLSGLS